MRKLRRQLPGDPGHDEFFSTGLAQEALRQEVFFLAYHLHWSWAEIMNLESDERRAFVQLLIDQIERENAQLEASRRAR
ncbi:DUF6760 family protein [Corallococcus sp. AS-1-6]|uniref:DUF6760 family protein n=1 Tax=Corallococcus sp. AS-1-6 TaxID=2874599 RepID=UPI00359FBFBB